MSRLPLHILSNERHMRTISLSHHPKGQNWMSLALIDLPHGFFRYVPQPRGVLKLKTKMGAE